MSRARTPAPDKDLGFGGNLANQGDRFVNRDGTPNVEKRGVSFGQSFSFYHAMIGISWGRFFWAIFGTYLLINLGFATVYFLTPPDSLLGMHAHSPAEKFLECFFFSVQTFTTVGYGRVSPMGLFANLVVMLELLVGLLSLALATGLFYGRFTRPSARIVFSANALLAPYQGHTGLMFRLANARRAQLVEVEARVLMAWVEPENGQPTRRFAELPLERSAVSMLPLSWTVVHPITPQSPLHNQTADTLAATNFELLVSLKGFDEVYGQTIYARTSYKYTDLVWGAKFVSSYGRSPTGATVLDFATLSKFEMTG